MGEQRIFRWKKKISTLEERLFIWKWYASSVITMCGGYIDRVLRHFNTCINGTALNQTVRTDWVRPIEPHKSSASEKDRFTRSRIGGRRRKKEERESESLWLRAKVSLKRVRCRETYRTIGFSFQRVTLPFIGPDKESLGLVCPDGLTFIGERYMEIIRESSNSTVYPLVSLSPPWRVFTCFRCRLVFFFFSSSFFILLFVLLLFDYENVSLCLNQSVKSSIF